MPRRLPFFLFLGGCTMLALDAAAVEPVEFTLRFSHPESHYVEIEASVPTDGKPDVEVLMAVWTPGSYLVREYARHVEGLVARDAGGKPLDVEKVRKNRWRIETGGAPRILLSYRVYCREMSVQANWVDRSFALLNGAATFLTPADSRPRPHEVTVHPHPDWSTTISGLPEAQAGPARRYLAEDFDALVDSPIYAGSPAVYAFEVGGKAHLLVNEGEAGIWDGPRSARDVEAIVRAQREF